jgi:hypothetical protein
MGYKIAKKTKHENSTVHLSSLGITPTCGNPCKTLK